MPWVWCRLSPCFAELKHNIHYPAIQNMLLPKVELAWDLKTSKSHYSVQKQGASVAQNAFHMLNSHSLPWKGAVELRFVSVYICVCVCVHVFLRVKEMFTYTHIRFLWPETILSDAWVSQVTFPPSSHQNPCQSYCIKLICLTIFPALLWKWITVLLTDCMGGVWVWIWTEVTFIKGYDTVFQSDERW